MDTGQLSGKPGKMLRGNYNNELYPIREKSSFLSANEILKKLRSDKPLGL